MKTKKIFVKIVSIALAAIMAFAVTGCKPKTNDKGEITISDDNPRKDDLGDDVYVSVLDLGFGTAWVNAAAEAYKAKTGINVYVTGDSDLSGTVATKMGTNSVKDDLYFSAFTTQNMNRWTRNNLLVPIDDVLSESVYGTSATSRVADPYFLKLGKVGDKTYSTPYIYANWGMIYNEELLGKIESRGEYTKGEFPKTMRGLVDLCAAVKDANLTNERTGHTVSPFSCGLGVLYMDNLFYTLWYQLDPEGWHKFFDQNNAASFDRTTFDNDAARTAMEWVYELMGPVDNAHNNMVGNSQNHTESQTSFVNGDCVFTFCGTWFETEMKTTLDQVGMTGYRYTAYPVIDSADAEANKKYSQPNLPGESFFIPSDAANVAGAKDFLSFIMSEEGVAAASEAISQPVCYTSDKTIEMTRFGNDIAAAVNSSEKLYRFSENDVFKTGACTLFQSQTNPFSAMAACSVSGTKSEIAAELVTREADALADNWTTYTRVLDD